MALMQGFGDPSCPADDAVFDTSVHESPEQARDPWSAVWRDRATGLTTCLFAQTKTQAGALLRKYPRGPGPDALWLYTDPPEGT